MNVQVQATVFSLAQVEESGTGDHRGIIGTKFDGWIAETDSERK